MDMSIFPNLHPRPGSANIFADKLRGKRRPKPTTSRAWRSCCMRQPKPCNSRGPKYRVDQFCQGAVSEARHQKWWPEDSKLWASTLTLDSTLPRLVPMNSQDVLCLCLSVSLSLCVCCSLNAKQYKSLFVACGVLFFPGNLPPLVVHNMWMSGVQNIGTHIFLETEHSKAKLLGFTASTGKTKE